MGGRGRHGGHLGTRPHRSLRLLLVALLGGSWLLLAAGPAPAAIILSPSHGPRSSHVAVAVSGFQPIPCAVLFDGAQVATSTTCGAGLGFDVPESAAAGDHNVNVVVVGDGIPVPVGAGSGGTAGGVGGAGTGAAVAPRVFVARSAQTNSLGTATFTVEVVIESTTTEATTTTTVAVTTPTEPPATVTPGTTTPVPATSPRTIPPPVAAPVPVPPVSSAEATCRPSTPPVARLAAAPARGGAGATVRVTVDWAGGGDCGVRPGLLTFDGVGAAGPVPSTTGPVEVSFAVPADAKPGPHVFAVAAVDNPTVSLATAPFDVEVATAALPPASLTSPASSSPSSGLPLAAVLIGATVVVGAVGTLIVRANGPEPAGAGVPVDPCGAGRVRLEAAQVEVTATRAAVEQARERAHAADERAESLRHEEPASPAAAPEPDEGRAAVPIALPVLTAARRPDPLLLNQENPHAPRRPNGKRGWYRTYRTVPARAIVVAVRPGRSAGEVATTLTYAPRADAGHVAVDADGVVGLLPDDHVALFRPDLEGADEALLVAFVVSPAVGPVDDQALRQLAAWCRPRMRAYDVPARRVMGGDWTAGAGGFLAPSDLPSAATGNGGPGPEFPWDRFFALLGRQPIRAIPGIVPGNGATPPALAAPVNGDHPGLPQAEADARSAREDAAKAEQRARDAEARMESIFRMVAQCECRDLPSPEELVPVPVAPPAEPAPTEDKDNDDDGRFYLLEHENEFGGQRANGKYGWYYPTRSQPIRGIVVHTAESMDALGVAQYLATIDRAAAAHVVVDTDVTVPLLPDETTAFHAVGGNSAGLGIEIAYKAALWGTQSVAEEMLLIRSAAWCGLHARLHDIPVRRITVEEWEGGGRGFISHAELDPANRTDPGPDFPWDRFMALTDRVAGTAPA